MPFSALGDTTASWSLYQWLEPEPRYEQTVQREQKVDVPSTIAPAPELIQSSTDSQLADGQTGLAQLPVAGPIKNSETNRSFASRLSTTGNWLILTWVLGCVVVAGWRFAA